MRRRKRLPAAAGAIARYRWEPCSPWEVDDCQGNRGVSARHTQSQSTTPMPAAKRWFHVRGLHVGCWLTLAAY
jgi:hypothetical protein